MAGTEDEMKKMKLSDWPKVSATTAEALIVIQHFRRRAEDDFEFLEVTSLAEAGEVYKATCSRLQCGPYHQSSASWPVLHVAYGPVEGEPGAQYGSMGVYGVMVTLYVKDIRRPNGWQVPGIDKNGLVYNQAFTRPTEQSTLPGYGYMRKREPRKPVPKGTAWDNGGTDLVHIGGVRIPQEELNRVYRETGALPTHVTSWDPSGSVRYLLEVVWGDEPQILAKELARNS